jgi:hypothetical protein
MSKTDKLAAAIILSVLGLAVALGLGLVFQSPMLARESRLDAAASKACQTDPTLQRVLKRAPPGSSERSDAYERCLIAHGVDAHWIPKSTAVTPLP